MTDHMTVFHWAFCTLTGKVTGVRNVQVNEMQIVKSAITYDKFEYVTSCFCCKTHMIIDTYDLILKRGWKIGPWQLTQDMFYFVCPGCHDNCYVPKLCIPYLVEKFLKDDLKHRFYKKKAK